MYLRSKGIL